MRCDACGLALTEEPPESQCLRCGRFTRWCKSCGEHRSVHVLALLARHQQCAWPTIPVYIAEAKPRGGTRATVSTIGLVGHVRGGRRPFP